MRRTILVAVSVIGRSLSGAQSQPEVTFRAESVESHIRVDVLNAVGKPYQGKLPLNAVTISIRKSAQSVKDMFPASGGPIVYGILIDNSSSQYNVFPGQMDAARVLLENSFREDDYGFLGSFGDRLEVIQTATNSKSEMLAALPRVKEPMLGGPDDPQYMFSVTHEEALRRARNQARQQNTGPECIFVSRYAEFRRALEARDLPPARINIPALNPPKVPPSPPGTLLLNALWGGVNELAKTGSPYRKALIVFTDGVDVGSAVSEEQLRDQIAATGVSIYVFRFLDPSFEANVYRSSKSFDLQQIDRLAKQVGSTGTPRNRGQIRAGSNSIETELRVEHRVVVAPQQIESVPLSAIECRLSPELVAAGYSITPIGIETSTRVDGSAYAPRPRLVEGVGQTLESKKQGGTVHEAQESATEGNRQVAFKVELNRTNQTCTASLELVETKERDVLLRLFCDDRRELAQEVSVGSVTVSKVGSTGAMFKVEGQAEAMQIRSDSEIDEILLQMSEAGRLLEYYRKQRSQ
jgi:hypothetical protein